MKEERFDAIVIGSGFGGSVMAYRLAEAGKRVCLLERGKPYPPTAFARSPAEFRRNVWDPSEGLQGLFDVWSFRGTDAVVSSGLGGGSLIYANVLLRKPERWFVKEDLANGGYERWPVTRKELDPHYDRAEEMLEGQPFPHEKEPYAQIGKTRALREAAQRAGYAWSAPKLAISFSQKGKEPAINVPIVEERPNLHGVARTTCRLCGECNVGCSTGSKNSLDYTYLSRADKRFLEVRTRSEVRRIATRDQGGYAVDYVVHTDEHEGAPFPTQELPTTRIWADKVILAAGTYGSTYLLLKMKNQNDLRALGPLLGTRVGGNGDFLSFAWKSHETKNGKRVPRAIEPTRGPVITSTVHVPDELDGGDGPGFYLQDAGIPAFVSWLAQPAEGLGLLAAAARFGWQYLQRAVGLEPDAGLDGPIASLIGLSTATGSSLPFLGMGRDVPDGILRLNGKWLELQYDDQRSRKLFDSMQEAAKRLADALDAEYKVNPLYRFRRLVTVHPLGGCPMGTHPNEGVVDEYGQVFGHPGLYVADGSVMPGPVGPNPALTIAALSDRFADRMLGN